MQSKMTNKSSTIIVVLCTATLNILIEYTANTIARFLTIFRWFLSISNPVTALTFWWRTIASLSVRHFSQQQRSTQYFIRTICHCKRISKSHDCVCAKLSSCFIRGSEWKSDIVTEKIEQNPHQKHNKYSFERYGILSVRIVVLDSQDDEFDSAFCLISAKFHGALLACGVFQMKENRL